MVEAVANALKNKDYPTAAQLLKQWQKTDPNNPWLKLYIGRFQEATGKLSAADRMYRQLLPHTTNPKIMAQARQGIARIEKFYQDKRDRAIAQAKAEPGGMESGLLILEPTPPEAKKEMAQILAKVMEIDAYTARFHLPSRGLRLYRTGIMGELKFYTQNLKKGNLPCFCTSVKDLSQINVYQVNYFQSLTPQVTVVCKDGQGLQGELTFKWSEVSQRVEGLIPFFGDIMDMDVRRKFQSKTTTRDYVQFCDLHLPKRNSILRLCDRQYQFQQGILLAQNAEDLQVSGKTTIRKHWNTLLGFLNQNLPKIPIQSDFTPFAETALDFPLQLKAIESHIQLSRKKESLWDEAFQLYSGLIFLKLNANKQSNPS